jgi:predicted nucleotidyltransferase
MKPSEVLKQHRAEIRHIIEANHGRNARVFGSVANGTDDEDSDLDLLIDGEPSLFDVGAMLYALEKQLGIKADVLTAEDIPQRFRDQVIREAVPL